MKFVFVFILALLPLLSFSQEGEMAPGQETTTADEKALEDLQRAQQERQKKIERVGNVTEATGRALNPVEQIKNIDYQRFNPSSVMSMDALNQMETLIRQAQLSKVSPDKIREQILLSFKGHPLENYVRSSPKLQDFMVDFMRDEKALISGIKIFKDRGRLKLYLYFWIGIMFATYYTRKLFISKYWSRPVKTIASLMFSLTVTIITMSTFCLIFEEEMRPIIGLVKKHL